MRGRRPDGSAARRRAAGPGAISHGAGRLRVVVDATPLYPQSPQLGPTGVGRWTRESLRHLAVAAPEWTIELLSVGLRGAAPDLTWAPPNVSLRRLPVPGRVARAADLAGLMPSVGRLLGPVDAVLAPAYVTWPAGRAAAVAVVHDLTHVHHPQFVAPRHLRYLRWSLPRALARAAMVVTVSHTIRREIIDHYRVAAERVAVVPNGCDGDRFRGVGPSPVGVAPPYFLFVGTLEPRKNLVGALTAHDRLRQRWPDAPPLVVVGGRGWRSDALIRALRAHVAAGSVRALGYVPEDGLAALYAHATCLVFPSHYEGFGLPVLEAMASGCPVIASGRGAIAEVTGPAALLIDPDDPDAIARAMQRVATRADLRARLVATGRQRAAGFTWQRSGAALRAALLRAVRLSAPDGRAPAADGPW